MRAEAAFAQARNCVIVATSTLELGIDVGDLDRVIQIDAPSTVASFLQRLGRTGRRPGTTRNCLFLATNSESLLRAAAIEHLWEQDWVEPVKPPPAPYHVRAQQALCLALQQRQLPAKELIGFVSQNAPRPPLRLRVPGLRWPLRTDRPANGTAIWETELPGVAVSVRYTAAVSSGVQRYRDWLGS